MLHFIDNVGALRALVHGAYRAHAMGALACVYQLILAVAGCRFWGEFVESGANIADGPTRIGPALLTSLGGAAINAVHVNARLPDLVGLRSFPLCDLLRLLERFNA